MYHTFSPPYQGGAGVGGNSKRRFVASTRLVSLRDPPRPQGQGEVELKIILNVAPLMFHVSASLFRRGPFHDGGGDGLGRLDAASLKPRD